MRAPATSTLLLLAAACAGAAQPKGSPAGQATSLSVHRLYEGKPRPAGEVAVLALLTPMGRQGTCVVGRITSAEKGVDFRPEPERSLAELLPGRYRLELYYWVGKSQIYRTAAGKRELLIRSLRSAEKVDAVVELEAGGTYFIDPELAQATYLLEEQRPLFFPLFFSKSLGLERRPPPEELEKTDEFVWRPRLKRLSLEEAAPYRSYR